MEEASSIFVLYEQIAFVDIIYVTTIFSNYFRCHKSHTHFSIQLLSVIYKFQHYKQQNTFFSCLLGVSSPKSSMNSFITHIFFFFCSFKKFIEQHQNSRHSTMDWLHIWQTKQTYLIHLWCQKCKPRKLTELVDIKCK